MKRILNSNGFSAIEVALLVIVIGIISGTGYYVYNSQKETKKLLDNSNTSEPADTSKAKPTQEPTGIKENRKTISYQGASYSFALPDGWNLEEFTGYEDEYIARISDPTSKYMLDLQTNSYTGSTSEGNETVGSFVGINSKTYYLQGYKSSGTRDFTTLFISACETKLCMTPLNGSYKLNLSVQRTGVNNTEGVSVSAKEVETIKKIVNSIKLGS